MFCGVTQMVFLAHSFTCLMCPHRCAPLSEGRIESRRNTLQCSYHDWEFNNEGKCTKITQLEDTTADPSILSQRACLTLVPITTRQHLVFIWPDISPDGKLLAALSSPKICEEIDNIKMVTKNVLDPAHVPFAHHGLQGNRDKPNNMAIISTTIDDNSFIGNANRTSNNAAVNIESSYY
eukprot:gene13855-29486_t